MTTAAGAVAVRAPRVNDKRIDETDRGAPAVLLGDPARVGTQVAEGGRGVAAAVPARPVQRRLRPGAGAVPRHRCRPVAATITRLTTQWQDEAAAFGKRLAWPSTDYVYMWVDGIHLKVRLEQDKVCLLVIIGVRADGTKELVALDDGHRESTESWADLLRDCKRRGMRAPVLAVGDGALGFWAAVREVFPDTREQRCWFHKIANVLNALPKSAQPGAKTALAEIWNAEDQSTPRPPPRLRRRLRRKWPKAAAKITDDLDVLLEFYDYPAEHWIHLRTTNPIWVFGSRGRSGRCFPGRRSRRPALTLNAIDAARLSLIRGVGLAA